MPASVIQPSFAGGELSPSLYGRVDLARYETSLKTCRNFISQLYGGVRNRTGSRFIAEVADSSVRSRLIPFAFSTEQTYVLEFSHLKMRVFKDGGLVVNSSGPNVGDPFELVTPYEEEDLPDLKYTQSADVMTIVHPDYAPRQLSRTDHDAWTIAEFAFTKGPFQEINSDTNVSVWASATTGTSVTITANSSIFSADNVGQLFYVEQKDFGVPWETNKAVSLNDIRRSDGKYYQAQGAGTTGTLRPVHDSDDWSDGTVFWRYLHPGFGSGRITSVPTFTSKNVTGAVDNGSGAIRITVTAHGYQTGDYVTIAGVLGVTAANGNWVITRVGSNTFDLNGSTFSGSYTSGGTAIIVAGSKAVISVTDRMPDGAVLGNNPTYKWAFGAWGGNQGWPSTVNYHQQRLVFANTPAQPQTAWMSRVNSYPNFGTSTPIEDDDAITFTLASRQVNAIRHLIGLDRLILFTSGGEWLFGGDSEDVITPATIGAKAQGYRGTSEVPPLVIGNTAIFIQSKGRTVRDLGYEFASDSFTGNDLTVLASHLTENKVIEEWAYQQVPFSCVWSVQNDGSLLGLTYMREQQVIGWHRHDTQDGAYESVCVIEEGAEDALYVTVRRTVDGQTKRYVERFASRNISEIKDAFFVDSGITYDGRNTSSLEMTLTSSGAWTFNGGATFTLESGGAHFVSGDVGSEIHLYDEDGRPLRLAITTYVSGNTVRVTPNRDVPTELRAAATTNWTHARKTFTGADHLEGKTLNVLADGNVHPQVTIDSGAFELQYAAGVVHVGLPIEADFETLDLSIPQGETVRDKRKIVSAVRMLVEESRGIFAGKDANSLLEYKQRASEGYDDPVSLLTGLMELRVIANWNQGGRIFVRQSDPLPLSILAAIPEVTVGGPGGA